jgi:DNA-directed RNA polymerase specialized sigma24 family protein
MSLELKMIYHRAGHYARTTGQPLEDLVQEGIVASLEAETTFDPKHGAKLTTWQWWRIELAMKMYCRRAVRVKFMEEPPEQTCECNSTMQAEFEEQLRRAPADVRFICNLILQRPHDFAGLPQQQCRAQIRGALTELGWRAERVREALQDCKAWLGAGSAEVLMRRTAA